MPDQHQHGVLVHKKYDSLFFTHKAERRRYYVAEVATDPECHGDSGRILFFFGSGVTF